MLPGCMSNSPAAATTATAAVAAQETIEIIMAQHKNANRNVKIARERAREGATERRGGREGYRGTCDINNGSLALTMAL